MNETATGSPQLERYALLLVLTTFGFFGVAFGVWLVLLAELQATFSLSPATLGAALATGLSVSLPVMALSGRAVDRWDSGVVIAGSVSVTAVALIGTALAPTYSLLLPFFLLFYSATAAFDGAGLNSSCVRTRKQVTDRSAVAVGTDDRYGTTGKESIPCAVRRARVCVSCAPLKGPT